MTNYKRDLITHISGCLNETIKAYLNEDINLILVLTEVISAYVCSLFWDNKAIAKYKNWFFINKEDLMKNTKLDDQQISEALSNLAEKNLISLNNSMYGECYHLKINIDFIESLCKVSGTILKQGVSNER